MCSKYLEKIQIVHICLLLLWLHNLTALRLKSGKSYSLRKKTTHRYHERYKQSNDNAARRSTFHISMPAKVAKLILPRITNKNQETIIRIYPDKAAESQNQTGRNFLMSLSYKKLNDSTPQDSLFRDPQCGGGCCCCPDMNVDPMSICRPGCPRIDHFQLPFHFKRKPLPLSIFLAIKSQCNLKCPCSR
ncbi:PREDICTED: uncharacterized protein LOC107335553 [Acropora digitifera]|uniref:uncharacterized protein LOC107335553 n=1 Tax=Acropora digitifera TaxID=70779 RepID=UPI00077B0B40|nr:PREDICTED: uncharacterized protein LOC107335553 [Acropora digitifera]